MLRNKLTASLTALMMAALANSAGAGAARPLHVCARADDMPFSNAGGGGFENKIAALIGEDLDRSIAFVWLPSQTGDAVAALNAGRCDLIVGLPVDADRVAATRPYYWSSYVLISRADRRLDVSSLKDHRIRGLKIGVASIGGDELYSPPARTLAQIGLGKNLIGYSIDGGAGSARRRARIVAAVADGDVDIAAVWGPLVGYFVKHSAVPLTMTPIGDTDQFSSRKAHFELIGLQYEMAMGVRPGDETLRDALDRAIARDRPRIEAVLRDYDVPLLDATRLSAAAPRGIAN